MNNMSKIIKCLMVGLVLLSTPCNKAMAAFPFPPMPGEPSFDGVSDAGKLLVEAYKTKNIKGVLLKGAGIAGSQLLKGPLSKMAGGLLGNKKDTLDKSGNKKAPGKGTVVANSQLHISENSIDETEFYNAFQYLFLTYDLSEDSGYSTSTIKTAYRQKTLEFKEDMAIDTYLTSKMMEDYLATIEATLNRLEKCQSIEYSEEECVFFGMKMEKVDMSGADDVEETGEDNAAQMGVSRNAFIVTTIQDRLLRIIEELTALEAIFQSSVQLDRVDPVDITERHSSTQIYIPSTYQFAYNDSQEHIAAKGTPLMKFSSRSQRCQNGDSSACPNVNTDSADVKSLEDTSVVTMFKDIEDTINQAVKVHNLKSSLHQYKNQYRQYLLQKKIHEDTKKLVTASDKCIEAFLGRHYKGTHKTTYQEEWYGGKEPLNEARYDYANRKGLSGELIKIYDSENTNITIGSSDECDGFYEENACPAGLDWDNTVCCEENSKMCACVTEVVTQDISDTLDDSHNTALDENPIDGQKTTKMKQKYANITDTDGFKNASRAEEFKKGSRQSVELTWKLGRDMLLKAMQEKGLTFEPWADQKMLQSEYLRNKYRNIGLIIKSTDQGVVSFKIASEAGKNYLNTDNPTQRYIESATLCESLDKAAALAKVKYCKASEGYYTCEASAHNGMIVTKRTKRQYGSDGKLRVVSLPDITETQKVSLNNTCTYKKETTPEVNPTAVCLTPQCLVQKYFTTAWGNASGFYNGAKERGREVATDKLLSVLNTRAEKADEIEKLITAYHLQKKSYEAQIKAAINNLTVVNTKIDEARKNKNTAETELLNGQRRVESINTQISKLNQRKSKVHKAEQCAIERQIGELNNEKSCIENGKAAIYGCETCKQFPQITPNDCRQIKVSCEKYLTELKEKDGLLVINADNSKDTRYVTRKSAEASSAKYENIAEEQTARLDALKARVTELQDELENITDKFAEDYIAAENDAQTAIEAANVGFEEYLDSSVGSKYARTKKGEPYRMRNLQKKECYNDGFIGIGCSKKGPKRILKDNMEATFTNIIQSGSLKDAMKNELNRVFFASGKVTNMLKDIGVPNNFVVDETFEALGAAGAIESKVLAEKLQDMVIETAAEVLASNIKAADTKVEEKVAEAAKIIDDFTKNHKINGKGTTAPETDYLENPSEDHGNLLRRLRKISKDFINGENVFGIPEDSEFEEMLDTDSNQEETEERNIVDTEFFVGLPARGNNYLNKTDDENAGRDFMAPKNMLSSLPPLREVFYFSPAEYDEIPQNNGKPVISELLNCKYFAEDGTCTEEYLPDIWLHILARPNLRQDRKYQQTFVERSFGSAKLNDLVQNKIANNGITNARDADYRAIIGRGGIYPCQKNGRFIDINGGDAVQNMRFKTRSKMPANMNDVINECQEVRFEKNDIYHLLADHGPTIKTDRERPSTTTEPMYKNYSELGQLLTKDLRYRPLQQDIQEYLMNKNPTKDITRQKAEGASFRRNTFGSFLDAITKEYNARKNVETSKKTIEDTMKNLCTQLEELGIHYNNCEAQAMAKDYLDNIYFEKNAQNQNGIICSTTAVKNKNPMYEDVFCKLDNEKDRLVKMAQDKLNNVKKNMDTLSDEAKTYVNERIESMEQYISNDGNKGTLIVDNNEVSTIQPNIGRDTIANTVKTAKANRNVEIMTMEDAIQAMANQSQAAAYCPVY